MQWWETTIGRWWLGRYDDRIEFNLAQQYVEACKDKDRERVERIAARMKVPFRKRNQDTLRVALDVVYRRVLGDAGSGSVGGYYRTMTEAEFRGSEREAKADAHYQRLR